MKNKAFLIGVEGKSRVWEKDVKCDEAVGREGGLET